MVLETLDEVKAQGVTVYDYRQPETQPLDVAQFNVPSWARWIAADATGVVYAYKQKPVQSNNYLFWTILDFGFQNIGRIDMTGIDWRKTLAAVNQEAHEPAITAAPDPVTLFVTLWQKLDGMQECEAAAAMVRDDPRRADGFFTTLGAAIESVVSPQYNPVVNWVNLADAAVNPANIVGVGPIIPVGPTPYSGSLYRYDEELDD